MQNRECCKVAGCGLQQLPQLVKVMKKRGITKEQYAVAPVDVFESEHLKEVK